MEVEIQEADARGVGFGRSGEFPRQIDREGRGPRAAGQAVNRQDHPVTVALGFEGGVCARLGLRGRGGSRFGHSGRGGLAGNRLVQRPFGQWVGHEIIGAQPQELMQRDRADLIGDQDHFDRFLLGRANDIADPREIGFIFAVDRDGDEFQLGGFRLVQEDQGIFKTQIAPVFPQLLLHVVDRKVKVLHIPRDGAGQDRRGIRLQIGDTRHHNSPSKGGSWPCGLARTTRTESDFGP